MLPLILAAGLALATPEPLVAADRQRDLCEYGTTCGLLGRLEPAERAFTALLSEAPRDPRALNGLGNVALLRLDVALAERCFARAAELEPTDPGLVLNRAVALLVGGDTTAAQAEAARGIRMAGDVRAAGDLLGVMSGTDPGTSRGATRGFPISARELRQFLENVARGLRDLFTAGRTVNQAGQTAGAAPAAADSGAAPPDSLVVVAPRLRPPLLRQGGPRSGRPDTRDLANTLYWKQ